jgi:hypothetical protein
MQVNKTFFLVFSIVGMSLKNQKLDNKGKWFAGQLFRTQFLSTPDIQHEVSVKKLRVYIRNESNFTGMEDSVYQ